MNKTKITLTNEQFEKIVQINKEGGDPVLYLSGGNPIGRSLQEKINDYWRELGKDMSFDWRTVESINGRDFYVKLNKSSKQ